MPKHGSIILYVHGNQKARWDGQPRTSTSTLTQLLNYANVRHAAPPFGLKQTKCISCIVQELCDSPSLISRTVSVDVKHHVYLVYCVRDEVAVLGRPS